MADDELVVTGRVGQPVVLPVAPGAFGYVWHLQLPPGLQAAGETSSPPPAATALGAPTSARLLVEAALPGSYRLLARLARPDQSDVVRSLVLRVEVS